VQTDHSAAVDSVTMVG